MIIGYYPKKLVPALKLDIQVDLSGKTSWLSEKYTAILCAAMRATNQLSEDQLAGMIPWRPQSARDLIVHIISFPELAWLSHEHGSMSTEDMAASNQRLKEVASAQAINEYGEGVLRNITEFLASGNDEAFDRVVPAHYGGEVTVLELLNIILSHSAHHLKQVYYFMEKDLDLTLEDPATDADLEGIVTPEALI